MNDSRSLAAGVLLLFWSAGLAGQASADTLTLRRAIELALARAPEIGIARAEADEAAAAAGAAEAGLRPEASARTTPGYATGLPVLVAGQVPALFGVAVRTSLYDPSRTAAVWTARADAAGRQPGIARARAATVRAVAASYERNAADAALLEAARRTVEGREAIERRAAALVREGRATPLDLQRASLDVARAKQRVLDRSLSKDFDALELRRLIGWPAGEALRVGEEALLELPDPPASGNFETALRGDAEIRALDGEIESLERAARLQRRLFQPSIAAEAQYLRLASYNRFEQYFVRFKADDLTAAVTLSVPLWTGGRNKEAASERRARLERAESARRLRERDVELAVAVAEADLIRARGELGVSQSAEAAAAEGARIARALATEGRGGADDVELTEIAHAATAEQRAAASQGLLAARLRLLDLRGDLDALFAGR
ncbi:MAG: TolC family protein [Acidobacteriota bacterium]